MVVIQLKIMILLKFTISCYTYFVGKKKGQNFVYQLYFIILYQGALLSCLEYFIFYFKYCFVSFAMYFLFPGFDFFERGILNIQIFKLSKKKYPDFSYLSKSHHFFHHRHYFFYVLITIAYISNCKKCCH